ncbi:unnamed protein product [Phytomonas sp. Hart1]|nr:unnamed protein product [Phytomonas sp. Hart1]|eukprot:CCW70246.1 unnamed protein product [Phytomonas sp. isolate Hart1]
MPFEVSYPLDNVPMHEGEPFYSLQEYKFTASNESSFSILLRAFPTLPPSDAVGLLSGFDSTGLTVWNGSLAFVEWLVRDRAVLQNALSRPYQLASGNFRVNFLDLGCGCGILSMALWHLIVIEMKRQANATVTARIIATDGNKECVSLCSQNFQEQCQDGTFLPLSCCGKHGVQAEATMLNWGDDSTDYPKLIECCDRVVILSAEVIYTLEAIPLLISTVCSLRKAFYAGTPGYAPGVAIGNLESIEYPRLQWWLLYTPRSLSVSSNKAIYEGLIAALAAQSSWTFQQIEAPAGSLRCGFESASLGEELPLSLKGCIFVVNLNLKKR